MSKFIAFFLGMFVVAILWSISWGISTHDSFDVSNIPDMEKLNDLNNKAAKDRFCQSMGYTESKLYPVSTVFVTQEKDNISSPYGYYILCKRMVSEKEKYFYSDYKKWLISLEITNNT